MLKIRNNTSFPNMVRQLLRGVSSSSEINDKFSLLYHQRLVTEYVMKYSNLKGLLIYHEMGSGKSILIVTICEILAKQYPHFKKIFLVPKSLKDNILLNMKKIGIYNDDYIFISSNSNNLSQQLKRKFVTLDDSIIVIDEAHNLFNALVNGSSNAGILYGMLRESNAKIILATGTPITNVPFELCLMFNVLSEGPVPLFPEFYNTFEIVVDKILNDDNEMIKKVKSRIYGLVSYYKNKEDNKMAKLNARVIVDVKMSDQQFIMYRIKKQKEDEEKNIVFGINNKKFIRSNSKSSSYKINTRQLCNVLYPDENKLEKYATHDASTLNDTFYKNISIYSPKIKKILEIVKDQPNKKGYIYSQFLDCGLYPLGGYLKYKGWEEFNDGNAVDESIDKYCYLTGETPEELKNKYLTMYNSVQNRNGSIIRLLLISSVASQGLSLNEVRYFIIMEPYWNQVRIDQVESRGRRIDSHIDLPEKDRNITPYLLLAETLDDNDSTDKIIYNEAIEKQKINNIFLNLIKESSIDCFANYNNNCFDCKPTSLPLFNVHKNIIDDFVDNCERWDVENVSVEEIVVNCKKYFFNITGSKIRIFIMRDDQQYEEIFVDDVNFESVYNEIKKHHLK